MKAIFNEFFFQSFNTWVLPLAIVWSLSSVGGIYLPNSGIEKFINRFEPFFEIFNFGEKFGILENFAGAIHSKMVTTKTMVPYPYRINAIFRAQSGSFVSIYDGKETLIVPLRGQYMNIYRLIGLSDTAAIFRGNGKTYRLRLGHDDMLSREEVMTHSIADPLAEASKAKEWHSITYQTVMNQVNAMENLEKSIDISESKMGEKFMGYRINALDSESIFAQLGLMSGDIIQSVNNQKLESFADVVTVYSKFPHLRSIKITVLRNNLPKDIVYEITH